ncbi:MAG: glycosyltransferase family 1 protein [Gammaproteobacteria bacterium]|nr:glycosyltransferase family 1 protein [Gammaproteobacteria bacterium]
MFFCFSSERSDVMQRVLIDITRLLRNASSPRGTSRTVEAYWQHYRYQACAVVWVFNQLLVMSPRASTQLFSLLVISKQKKTGQAWFIIFREWLLFRTWKQTYRFSRHPERSEGSPHSSWRSLAALGMTLRATQPYHGYVFFNVVGHTGVEHARYHDLLKKMGVIPIFMIQDLIPIHFPHYCSPGFQKRFHVGIKLMLERASGLLTNSEATRDAVIAHAATLGITSLPLLLPVHHGLSTKTEQAHLSRLGLGPTNDRMLGQGPTYFVVLGAVEPRKNHQLLLRVWERLILQSDLDLPHLLIIGQMTKMGKDIDVLIKKSDRLKNSVFFKSNLNDGEMIDYLYHAQALLFPTFTEGYGFPVIEALSLGVPVIASDLPVFREFSGDIPEYIDSCDEDKWFETIQAYRAPNSVARSNQLKRLAAFTAPSWDAHFKKVDNFLEMLR